MDNKGDELRGTHAQIIMDNKGDELRGTHAQIIMDSNNGGKREEGPCHL